MVEKVAMAIHGDWAGQPSARERADATAALDAILPQVTTVAELEVLSPDAMLMAPRSGVCLRADEVLSSGWPESSALIVVWTPEEGDRG